MRLFVLALIASSLQACCTAYKMCNNLQKICCENAAARNPTQEQMNQLESAMLDLSKEVASLLWADPSQTEGLIDKACKDNPVCDAFANYKLEVKVVGDNAVLLLCSPDGKRALVEDITCTATPDFKAWAECQEMPCTFTLNEQHISDACRLGSP